MSNDPSILTPAAAEYRARTGPDPVSEISNLKSSRPVRPRHDGFLLDAICFVIIYGLIAAGLFAFQPFLAEWFFFVSFVLFVVNRLDRDGDSEVFHVEISKRLFASMK